MLSGWDHLLHYSDKKYPWHWVNGFWRLLSYFPWHTPISLSSQPFSAMCEIPRFAMVCDVYGDVVHGQVLLLHSIPLFCLSTLWCGALWWLVGIGIGYPKVQMHGNLHSTQCGALVITEYQFDQIDPWLGDVNSHLQQPCSDHSPGNQQTKMNDRCWWQGSNAAV